MKKIVAYLTPVPEAEESNVASSPAVAGSTADETSNCDQPPYTNGVMKLQATVSDSQAHSIIAMMMGAEEAESKPNLERLLQSEIDMAGPDAQDLFKRIVVGVERELISRVYSECNHVKTRAAARLGIDRNTLHKKLRQHHLADDEISDS